MEEAQFLTKFASTVHWITTTDPKEDDEHAQMLLAEPNVQLALDFLRGYRALCTALEQQRALVKAPKAIDARLGKLWEALQPELPAECQTVEEGEAGGPARSYLTYLATVTRLFERAERQRAGRAVTTHVRVDKSEQKNSIQERIHK